MSVWAGFAQGFQQGWNMMDGFLEKREERLEKQRNEDDKNLAMDNAEREAARNLAGQRGRDDDTARQRRAEGEMTAGGLAPEEEMGGIPRGRAVDAAEEDIDLLARTIIGEARGEPIEGKIAVAHVVRNRLLDGGYGQDMRSVLFAPRQFEPWNTRRDELMRISPESRDYQTARRIAEQVMRGDLPDPTRGALNFANVATVRQRAARGETSANTNRWVEDVAANGIQIGRHTFGTPGQRPGRQPERRAAIETPEAPRIAAVGGGVPQMITLEELEGQQGQPGIFANSGGAVPDPNQAWKAQAPDARGSVFLQNDLQNAPARQPRPAAPAMQQPAQAAPAMQQQSGIADRFRAMRQGHADRRAAIEAEQAQMRATQSRSALPDFSDQQVFDGMLWQNQMRNAVLGNVTPQAHHYAQAQQSLHDSADGRGDRVDAQALAFDDTMRRLYTAHHQGGGLRTDPSGRFLVEPPGTRDMSSAEWRKWQQLPKADNAFIRGALGDNFFQIMAPGW